MRKEIFMLTPKSIAESRGKKALRKYIEWNAKQKSLEKVVRVKLQSQSFKMSSSQVLYNFFSAMQ